VSRFPKKRKSREFYGRTKGRHPVPCKPPGRKFESCTGRAITYEASIKPPPPPPPLPPDTTVTDSGGTSKVNETGLSAGDSTTIDDGGTKVIAPKKAKAYYGSIQITPSGAKMQMVNVADEIISLLASDPNAILKVTIEINADFPHGATDQIKRATSENARALGFQSSEWE